MFVLSGPINNYLQNFPKQIILLKNFKRKKYLNRIKVTTFEQNLLIFCAGHQLYFNCSCKPIPNFLSVWMHDYTFSEHSIMYTKKAPGTLVIISLIHLTIKPGKISSLPLFVNSQPE